MANPSDADQTPKIIDIRDLIGDPEDAAPEDRTAVQDSPGTPGGTAGAGGTNKPQDDLDL
ncbi:MAG TPA: hypothetical protein VF649_01005 [Sphingomonas sp.]|jgi:hypothetical protein|uniref:hypothetical protein n=1 Tax=Sphingomonas sp. TaxID=28214 RepID=UPI002EDA7321